MSKLKNLFVQMPALCGINSAVAEEEGAHNARRFELDVTLGEASPYARRNGQSSADRMQPAFGAWETLVDENDTDAMDTLSYLKAFAGLLDGKRAEAKGLLAEDQISELGNEEFMLREAEPAFPHVSAVLTIDEGLAAVKAQWG